MTSERVATRLGPLPPDWRVKPLGEVTEKTTRPIEVEPRGLYREIGIRSHGKGIFHKDHVKGETLGAKRVFQVVPERLVFNIVFAWEGAVAVTSKHEQGMIASHRFPMFGPTDARLVDVEFLRRFFQTELGVRLLGDASPGGAGRNRTLNQKFAAEIPVPVPPLGEQKKIAAILSAVDEAIDATQAVIDQLQVVKKAILTELLTRGLPGRHTRFKHTELGELPDDWDIQPLHAVADVFNGKAAGAGGTWLRVFKTKHVYDGMLRLDRAEFARDDVALRVPESTYLRANDVLTPNMAHGTIGRVAFVPDVNGKWTVDGQVMVIRARPEKLLGRFAFEWFSVRGRQHLLDLEKGGAFDKLRGQTHIYPRDVREVRVAIPPLPEQAGIVESATSIDEGLSANVERLSLLRTVKSGLLPLLLTGEVRVKPDEAAA